MRSNSARLPAMSTRLIEQLQQDRGTVFEVMLVAGLHVDARPETHHPSLAVKLEENACHVGAVLGQRQPVPDTALVVLSELAPEPRQIVSLFPRRVGDVLRVQVRGGSLPVVGVLQKGPHHLPVEAALFADGVREIGVPVETRSFVDQRGHTGLMGHGFDVLALRLDPRLLRLRQARERLEDNRRRAAALVQVREGDILQDAVPVLKIAPQQHVGRALKEADGREVACHTPLPR